jgi:hypothetical protein
MFGFAVTPGWLPMNAEMAYGLCASVLTGLPYLASVGRNDALGRTTIFGPSPPTCAAQQVGDNPGR